MRQIAKESSEDRVRALEKILNLSEQLHGNNKFDGKTVGQMKRDLAVIVELKKEELDASEKENKILSENTLEIEGALDLAGKIGKKIKDSVESIPFIGEKLSEVLDLEDLGERMQKDVFDKVLKTLNEGGTFKDAFAKPGKMVGEQINKNILGPLEKMGPTGVRAAGILRGAFTFLLNPVTLGVAALLAAFVGIFKIVTKIRKAQRDLGKELGISTKEARGFLVPLKASEKAFNMIGLDGKKIESTLGEIGKEFGSLENMTVSERS